MKKSFLDKTAIVLVFVLILSTYPYVFDRLLPIPGIHYAIYVIPIALLGLLILNKNNRILPVAYSLCVYFQILGWLMYYFIHNDISYITRILFLIITYIVILSLHSTIGVHVFFRKYNFWMASQAIMGGFAFVLIYVGLLHPILSYDLGDERTAYCFGLTCSNSYFGNFARVGGFFDEPGAFAFWGIFALLINLLYIKNKYIEYGLLIGLFFTFSLAYFAQVALYMFLLKVRGIKSLILVSFFSIILAGIVISQGEDSDIYIRTIQRVEKSQDKTNRDEMTDRAKEIWGHNVMIGVGGSNMAEYGYMGDNPYEILVKDGVVGYIITYLPLIFMIRAGLRRFDLMAAIGILFLGYQQRPFHIEFLHYFLLYAFLYMTLTYKKTKLCKLHTNIP